MNEKQINELEERINKLFKKGYEIKTFKKYLKEIEKDYHCKLAPQNIGKMVIGVHVYILK